MSELKICAVSHILGGPSLPSDHGAWIETRADGTPELNLQLSDVRIRLWPADPEKIWELAEKLEKIAKELLTDDGR